MAVTSSGGVARRVVVVGYDGSELLDIACVTSTLDLAVRIAGRTLYRTELISPNGQTIRCDSGLELHSNGSLQRATGPVDTLVVSGGRGHEAAAEDPAIVAHVRRLAALSRRVASVCTGATVLAAAGLLDGRRATTHWHYADALARRYPSVHVDPRPIFIRDGRVATSAGVTSALDLTLALVTEDCGPDLARAVAQGLVTYLQRPGNQAQMSVFTAPDPDHVLVRQAVAYVTAHLATTLGTAVLAGHCGVSTRQLHRLFVEHLGMPPGQFVRRTRLDTSARLLATTGHPVGMVARWCGFASLETFRQAFVAQYGVPPSQYRSVTAALADA
ncbi:GlxA family transcriptional regulator [Dactylosporangium sp. NPDC005555]|uniref:GlxA family transcriptional regulator n=1 Tax=Dactylosporangium sp. NPDC005555 TaxID=3154889 RepID=UPI0033B2A794